jgi:hypothetical protein
MILTGSITSVILSDSDRDFKAVVRSRERICNKPREWQGQDGEDLEWTVHSDD